MLYECFVFAVKTMDQHCRSYLMGYSSDVLFRRDLLKDVLARLLGDIMESQGRLLMTDQYTNSPPNLNKQ